MEFETDPQPQRTRIVLAYDEELIRELEDTTETQTPAGYTIYHPPKKGHDHNTDALRCVMAAILRHSTMQAESDEFPADEYGWINIDDSRRRWKAPWG